MILSVELCYELVPSEQSPLILYNQLTNNPFIFFFPQHSIYDAFITKKTLVIEHLT